MSEVSVAVSRDAYLHYAENDNRILTIKQWAEINSISLATARRIISRGEGPPIIKISPRRIGIRIRDNRLWQERSTLRPLS